MADYIDLLAEQNELTPDAGDNPKLEDGRASITQDINMIRESGLLANSIANRNALPRRTNIIRMIMAMDDDERFVSGTAEIEDHSRRIRANGHHRAFAQGVTFCQPPAQGSKIRDMITS